MKAQYINTKEAAELISMRPQTLRRWRSLGKGPIYIRLGGRNGKALYRLSDLEAWLRQRTFSSTVQECRDVCGARTGKDQEAKT